MTSQTRIGLILAFVVMVSAVAMVISSRQQASSATAPGNVNVTCGPSQRAVVEHASTGTASPVVNVSCIEMASTPASQYVPAYVPQGPEMVPVTYASPLTAHSTPGPSQRAAYQPQPVVVQQVSPSSPVRSATPRKPSVQKRLLVIGGTAGAGAGIGALVGGRKGALIGAAIGAGGAAAVDQVKHR